MLSPSWSRHEHRGRQLQSACSRRGCAPLGYGKKLMTHMFDPLELALDPAAYIARKSRVMYELDL